MHGFAGFAASAVGTPAELPDDSERHSLTAHSAFLNGVATLAIGEDRVFAGLESSPALTLLHGDGNGAERHPLAPLDRTRMFLLHFHDGIVWWSGGSGIVRLAVVTVDDEVHFLAEPHETDVRSEPLRAGDRIAVVSRSIVDSVHDLTSALEMALCDDPSPTSASTWLLDAADGDGATEDLYAGILRYVTSD